MHFHSHSFLANPTFYLQAGKQNLHVLDILQLQINDSPCTCFPGVLSQVSHIWDFWRLPAIFLAPSRLERVGQRGAFLWPSTWHPGRFGSGPFQEYLKLLIARIKKLVSLRERPLLQLPLGDQFLCCHNWSAVLCFIRSVQTSKTSP